MSVALRSSLPVALLAVLTTVGASGCAASGGPDGYLDPPGKDASVSDAGGVDSSMPAQDGAAGPDVAEASGDDASPVDSSPPDDSPSTGKTCTGLPDGTVCGPAPDICHDTPKCTGGVCGTAPAKANGFVCKKASDGCHTDGTCTGGVCGAEGTRADGYKWSTTDSTAICCGGQEAHDNTDSNCGVCGIVCNTSNGESCQILGGHYFCRGCVASAACWSHCCAIDFTPYTCAASDCSGNCDSQYCPAGTHCVLGNGVSSNYCSY